MKTFEEIQEKLGELPNYPKIYLLGSTGAGKTSIVRAILDTDNEKFPTTSTTRTTIAPTEYVISSKRAFKSTFIFKEKEDIESSIRELLTTAILKALSLRENEDNFNVISYLEETSDERFRLKHIVPSNFLEEINDYILETILPKIEDRQNDEEILSSQSIKSEIEYLVNKILEAITEKTKEICPDYKLFSDELYFIKDITVKKEFILRNKALLKSDLNSISPLIEYARIEGDLLAKWIPKAYEFILIDGEGIGHDLKEIKSSLSTRHLDFFNSSNYILLVEKSDDPFISGGKNAIETIFLNGYSKKFKIIFSKIDKMEVKDYKSALDRRIGNVENALKDAKIDFNLSKNQKYYFSNLHNKTDKATHKEINKLLKNIIQDFSLKKENPIELKYDFDILFSNLNTTKFLDTWDKRIDNEHWKIIEAFTRRIIWGKDEYRYLKPIFDYHTFIMQEVNQFLKKDNQLNSEIAYAQNTIKQEFSTKLLQYIREGLLDDYSEDWMDAWSQYGEGSGKRRKFEVKKIFNSFIPKESNQEEFNNFKIKMKQYLIDTGAKEVSRLSKININKVSIKNIYGVRNIEWNLNTDTNILIGKNGSGKSSILKIIQAYIKNDEETLKKFGNPRIELCIDKEFENPLHNSNNEKINVLNEKIELEYIDTFDVPTTSLIACREKVDKGQSDLDYELEDLVENFNKYKIKFDKIFKEKNANNQKEIQRILQDIGNGDVNEAPKIKGLKESEEIIKKDVYKSLNSFRKIIDSMFKDTNKKINLELIEESFSISSRDGELSLFDLSSGEKQVLIIFLTILLKENKPYILMMDEPENSLHSEWQIYFINNIRKLNPNVQIIIATHNPLLMMDREGDEIGKISVDGDIIDTYGEGTKYMDVSTTLLTYPQVSSLVGVGKMYKEINQLFKLKKKDVLSSDEKNEVDELEIKLGDTVATNFIYDRHYLHFLKFIQEHEKNIDFDKLTEISEEEMDELLGEFKDLFDD